MTTPRQENDFGDAMWNDNFYSSSAEISGSSSSNHINNLKKTVLPNSASSQSISAYLQESPKEGSRQSDQTKTGSITSTKSGPLKASPSLIALERILNKEDGQSAPLPSTIMEEEEEPSSTGGEDAREEVPNRPSAVSKTASSSSVTTFQTAASGDRNSRSENQLSEHYSASATTLSPIQDHETKTPDLGGSSQEAKHTFDAPDTATPSYEPISVSPNLSLQSVDVPKSPQHSNSTVMQRTPEPSEFVKLTNSIGKPVKNIRVTMPKPADTSSSIDKHTPYQNASENGSPVKPKYSSMLDIVDPPKKSASSNAATTPGKSTTSQTTVPKKQKEIVGSAPIKEVAKEPSLDKSDIQKHDEPNTAVPEKPVNTKRFSFRTMFKSKSKNHSLSQLNLVPETLEPSQPAKLSNKSRSTPDFSAFKKSSNSQSTQSKSKKTEVRKNLFTRKKSEGSIISNVTDSEKGPESSKSKTTQDSPQNHAMSKPERTVPRIPAPNITTPKTSTPKMSTPRTSASKEFTPKEFTPKITPPTISTPKLAPSALPKKSPVLDQSSMASPSVFSVETPPAALSRQGETIREVDDSDFLLENYNDTSRVNAEFADVESSPESRDKRLMHGSSANFLNQSLDPKHPIDMGSPFAVSYVAENYSPVNGSPRKLQSGRSASNRSLNAHLAGDALFPKLLDPHEVESIVSIERSRSMRSIRSNNKRSSFINYNGSDENIVLGAEVGVLRQPSMKNSGGILKNSTSSRELRDDLFGSDVNLSLKSPQLNDTPEPPAIPNFEESPASVGDERFTDFIEFTDFIDIDNLDFPDSPSMEHGSVASPRDSFAAENPEALAAESSFSPEQPHGDSHELKPTNSSVAPDESLDKSPVEETSGVSPAMENPDVIVVSSGSSPEEDQEEPMGTPKLNSNNTSDLIASPLDKTYEFAVENSQPERNPSKGPRPVSMSFKGFKGSSFKDQVLVQSGSHQSIHFDDGSFENSPVGQGFGSSDEDSDSEDEVESPAVTTLEDSPASTPRSKVKPNAKSINNYSSRRQQHMRNVLDLQPPRVSIPFHHNRIPSISDHSAASSPKSLTSFMSRIRRSPMGSPAIVQKPRVAFSSRIILYDTYHQDEYDRHPEIGTCNQLTPLLAQQIKDELNDLKANMEVHSDSICYTQFF